MRTESFEYTDGTLTFEGHLAYDESWTAPRPCVLVGHSWAGQSHHERDKAVQMAELGYVGFAFDVYGAGVRGGLLEDNSRLMQPLLDDRGLLRSRLLAALSAVRRHPRIDPDRIAAIGYCFGGLCVLDLARASQPQLKGVVSFHGILKAPALGPQAPIPSKVLMLHGYEDPTAPPEDVLAVARELTEAGCDWQLHAYGHTMHAFTFPAANFPEAGLLYNPDATRRSWVAMQGFLAEVLA